MKMIIMPELKAAMEPTERSMLPVPIMKVAPMAMIPVKALLVKTLVRLAMDRNVGLMVVPKIISATTAAKGPMSCHEKRVPSCLSLACLSVVGWFIPYSSFNAGGIQHDFFFIDFIAQELTYNPSAAHHNHSITQTDNLAQLRGNENAGFALFHQFTDEQIDLLFRSHIDTPRGFVQDHDVRLNLHHLTQSDLLLIASAQHTKHGL